jgi:hypothetical protein
MRWEKTMRLAGIFLAYALAFVGAAGAFRTLIGAGIGPLDQLGLNAAVFAAVMTLVFHLRPEALKNLLAFNLRRKRRRRRAA